MDIATPSNAIRYVQVKVSVTPEVASAFKAACAASGVSMADKLTRYMAEYANVSIKAKRPPDYATRRKRRAAVKSITRQLQIIMAAENKSRGNIPENLQGSVVFEAAEESVGLLEEVIELLNTIY